MSTIERTSRNGNTGGRHDDTTIWLEDHVTIVAGEYAGYGALVAEFVGERSLWVFITSPGKHEGAYVTVRRSSVVVDN